MAEVTLEGYNDLLKQFEELADFPDEKEMEYYLIRRARNLRNKIRRNAPRTKAGSGSFDKKTGRLKKSIQAKKFRRKYKGSPAVYVKINRKIAPHAHLVEYGTDQNMLRVPLATKTYSRGARKGTTRQARKALHFFIDGEEIFAKWVSPMPPNPFFRSTVDHEYNTILVGIEKDVVKIIDRINKK